MKNWIHWILMVIGIFWIISFWTWGISSVFKLRTVSPNITLSLWELMWGLGGFILFIIGFICYYLKEVRELRTKKDFSKDKEII